MQLRKKSFLLRTVYFIFPLPALSFIAPKTMESPPARLPPVALPLVYLIRHAHMCLFGCCVRCLQSVTIEDQVKFLFLIFSLLDASTQTIGPHPPTSPGLVSLPESLPPRPPMSVDCCLFIIKWRPHKDLHLSLSFDVVHVGAPDKQTNHDAAQHDNMCLVWYHRGSRCH